MRAKDHEKVGMDSITVSNYRCFGEQQTARLAPLTLFVGENSSGKTSLAAMIRALWDVTYAERAPDFKEAPYDLGGFEEIVHDSGARGGRAENFEAAFETVATGRRNSESGRYKVEVTFGPRWGAPVPTRRRISRDADWIEQSVDEDGRLVICFGTQRGTWKYDDPETDRRIAQNGGIDFLPPISATRFHFLLRPRLVETAKWISGDPELREEDVEGIGRLLSRFDQRGFRGRATRLPRPFASAPTRSHPRRTYDHAGVWPDAEGDYVPMYLAQLSLRDPDAWTELKLRLEEFGKEAGLFDEISVRHLAHTATSPFQIQVRKFGMQRKGRQRNLADVGYGVSQVLPLIAELLRDDDPGMMLLQQPEVHLHPSAAAAFGSLLCRVVAADPRRQRRFVVETHSDFIIDRVRMAVTDDSIGLRPEDVSIVYFERFGLEVRLHVIGVDNLGNLLDVPSGYRRFFLEESRKFLGL